MDARSAPVAAISLLGVWGVVITAIGFVLMLIAVINPRDVVSRMYEEGGRQIRIGRLRIVPGFYAQSPGEFRFMASLVGIVMLFVGILIATSLL